MMAAAATMNPLAAEAWRLRCRGLPEAQIAERPLPATRVLIGLGSSLSAIDDARLTPSEIALLLTIAKVARDRRGNVRTGYRQVLRIGEFTRILPMVMSTGPARYAPSIVEERGP